MMNEFLAALLSIAAAYLIGAVPFGMLFTKAFSGADVRTVGSGNIGATNVLRAAGKKAAILTLLADALKGFAPAFVVHSVTADAAATALAGAAAVVGHNFPVYLRFKGGKGIATGFGVMLAISPLIGLSCLIIWLISALLWKYSSLAGLLAFAAYPVLLFLTSDPVERPYGVLSLFLFGLIYIRHRENIKRLLAGTEPKIGQKK